MLNTVLVTNLHSGQTDKNPCFWGDDIRMYKNDLSGRPTPRHRQSQIQCFKLAFSVRAIFQFGRTLSGRKGLWRREEKWVVVTLLLGSTFLGFSDDL